MIPVSKSAPIAGLIILTDIDGTLLNNEKHLSRVFCRTCEQYGVHVQADDFTQLKTFRTKMQNGHMEEITTMLCGARWEDSYYYCLSKLPEQPSYIPREKEFLKEIAGQVSQNRDLIEARTDVVRSILALQTECENAKIGFSIIAVTNAARQEAQENLDLLRGVGINMHGLISVDDAKRPKPSPHPYIQGYKLALEHLKLPGVEATNLLIVMLEDSPPGGESAVRASAIIYRTNPSHLSKCFYLPMRDTVTPALTGNNKKYFVAEREPSVIQSAILSMLALNPTRRADLSTFSWQCESLR